LTAIKSLQRSPLFLKAKLNLYKTYIWPMMTFVCPAWAFISKSNIPCLQVVQNRALRLIGGYDWYTQIDKMHSDTEIPKLKSFIKCLALKLYASAKLSRTRYIKKLGTDSLTKGYLDPSISSAKSKVHWHWYAGDKPIIISFWIRCL
jgi:hypothetical protein